MLHVSKLHAKLFFVSKFISNDLRIQFNLNKCIIKSCDGEAITIVPHEQNLYKIGFVKVQGMEVANLVQSPMGNGALELWNRRLGHLNMNNVHTFQNMVSNMNLVKLSYPTSALLCVVCIEGKENRVAYLNKGGR